jgi:hypothetical protein
VHGLDVPQGRGRLGEWEHGVDHGPHPALHRERRQELEVRFAYGLDVILDGLERTRDDGKAEGEDMAADRVQAIKALLVQAEEAHGAFEATELNGVYDTEWARWYAGYAVEHGVGALVGQDVTADRLAQVLASSYTEYEQAAGLSEGWADYSARRIADEL